MVGQGGKFDEDTFGLTNSLGESVQSEFFSTSGDSDTQLVFNQLEVPVMLTEQDGGIGAFS